MSKILLSTLLILTLKLSVSYAQNYQPINSNSLQVFYQTTPFQLGWIYGANMWGTRIDSLQVSGTGDTIYYNYPIFRDTAEFSEGTICSRTPNWNGLPSRVKTNNHAWFYNEDGDSLDIRFSAPQGTEWTAFRYENGDSLVASVSQIFWVDDEWISDSVKTIEFIRYSDGLPTADVADHIVFDIYKNAGFRRVTDLFHFPVDTVSLFRTDINLLNYFAPGYYTDPVGPFLPLGVSSRPSPAIGDTQFYLETCDYSYADLDVRYQYWSSQVLNIVPSGMSGNLSVTKQVNYRTRHRTHSPPTPYSDVWSMTSIDTVTQLYINAADTFMLVLRDEQNVGLMPREDWAAYIYSVGSVVESEASNCQYPRVTIPPCVRPEALNENCLQYGECHWGDERTYASLFGQIRSYSWDWDVTVGDGPECDLYYTYIKSNGIECGEYAMVGIEQVEARTFSIYPNPTNGIFQIQMAEGNGARAFSAVVTDMLGRKVGELQFRSATLIDASQWANGVYSVSLVDENGARHAERLVVQH